MKRFWTILVDTREKRPLPMPSHLVVLDPDALPGAHRTVVIEIATRVSRLETGDYALEGHLDSVLVERKGHFSELATNFFEEDPRRRFLSCLSRLSNACRHPWILLEGDPLSLTRQLRDPTIHPGAVRDALLRACLGYNIGLHILPTSSLAARRACGEWVAALLLSGVHHAHQQAVNGTEGNVAL